VVPGPILAAVARNKIYDRKLSMNRNLKMGADPIPKMLFISAVEDNPFKTVPK
jgi:hypothetical protein